MIKNLLKYPDPMVRHISANVRFFNDELVQWITDMTDTMKEHNLDALSAILIGIQYSVIVMKEGDTYTPYINARLIKHAGMSTKTERSIYYEGISADVDRYETVTVIYEDEHGNPHHRDLEGERARVFQQQLDYCFGSTFVDRVDKEMKQRIHDYLEFGLVKDGGGSCPVIFYRDYFRRGARYVMGLIVATFAVPFFASESVRALVYSIDKYALILVPLLMIGYFLYAQYESRKYKQCTSCQTGNIIGTTAILGGQFLIVCAGVFGWVAP
ncbi:peptide deformylase [Sulfuricurvum sp.]|uniref:peptide deformylase n=1 Tax=Sulfuricurvum sp. TaxID=2025608 RepID=UPI0035653EA6